MMDFKPLYTPKEEIQAGKQFIRGDEIIPAQ